MKVCNVRVLRVFRKVLQQKKLNASNAFTVMNLRTVGKFYKNKYVF